MTEKLQSGQGWEIRGNRLLVKVRPNRPETKVVKVEKDCVVVDVAAPPKDNKANRELLRFLKRETGRLCRVVKGISSKTKLIVFEEPGESSEAGQR